MSIPAQRASHRARKNPHALAFHNEKPILVHRLPFVGNEHTEDKSFSFWNVPAKGGYSGGCETGESIAGMYLKYIRDSSDSESGMYLQWMILAWMERLASGGIQYESPEYTALKGQMVGFMSVISRRVVASARRLGSDLDNISYESLLDRANGGFKFDDKAFFQYCKLKQQFEGRSHV